MRACAVRGLLWIGLLCGLLAHRAQAREAEVRSAVEALRPGAIIESIAPAALKGLYEVFVDGDIVCVDEAGKTLLVGTLLDVAGKRNLTQERRDKLLVVNFAELPLELAVKIVKGSGACVTLAAKLRVQGTPTLVFVDGSRSPGLLPMAVLDKRLTATGNVGERKLAATAP